MYSLHTGVIENIFSTGVAYTENIYSTDIFIIQGL